MFIAPGEFTDFLSYIGLISKETEDVYTGIISEMENCETEQSIYDLLASSLHVFILQLSSQQLKEMTINMLNKFKENKLNSSHGKIMKLIIIYSKAQIVPLFNKYLQWKSIVKKLKGKASCNNNSNNNQDYHLEERPQVPIPKYPTKSSNNSNSVTNLVGTIQSTAANANIANNHHTNPNMNINANVITNHTNISHRPISKTTQNFIQRQERYKKIQLKSHAKVRQSNEEEFSMLCPFNPQINNYKNFGTISPNPNPKEKEGDYNNDMKINKTIENTPKKKTGAGLRLYEDSKARNIKRELKQNEINEEINKKANSKHQRNSSNPQIIKQYEDYKILKNNKNKLQEQIDIEQGITFTPLIHQRNKSSVFLNQKNNQTKSQKSISHSRCASQRVISKSKEKDSCLNLSFIKENGQ